MHFRRMAFVRTGGIDFIFWVINIPIWSWWRGMLNCCWLERRSNICPPGTGFYWLLWWIWLCSWECIGGVGVRRDWRQVTGLRYSPHLGMKEEGLSYPGIMPFTCLADCRFLTVMVRKSRNVFLHFCVSCLFCWFCGRRKMEYRRKNSRPCCGLIKMM